MCSWDRRGLNDSVGRIVTVEIGIERELGLHLVPK
jgi:hypothetical protein